MFSLLLLALPLASPTLPADTTPDFRDFNLVKQANPWLTSPNAAALTRYNQRNISVAEVRGSVAKGDFVDYSQSSNVVQAGAMVESFFRINARSVVYGRIDYDNFAGKNMLGSVFINPERKPFDLSEDSLTNPGNKHRDTYNLVGAVGIDLWRGLAVGAKVDYTAANYAKYKDLRHRNSLMQLNLSLGIAAPIGTNWVLGANYIYGRSTESLRFVTYGKTEKVYKTLVDYGAFTGEVEQFGNKGYTDDSREQPLLDEQNGLALQAESNLGRGFSLFLGAQMVHRNGFYGRNSPYSIVHFKHQGDNYALQLVLNKYRTYSQQQLSLSYTNEQLTNHKTTYRENQTATGSSFYEYFDPIKTSNKRWSSLKLAYTAWLRLFGGIAHWTISASLQADSRQISAYLYPYVQRQQLHTNLLSLLVTRNLTLSRRTMLSLTGGLSRQWGSGEPEQTATLATPSDKQKPPTVMQAYLYRNHHLLTAPQWGVHLAAKYAFCLPRLHLPLYVRTQTTWRRTTEPSPWIDNQHRTEATLAIGCTF